MLNTFRFFTRDKHLLKTGKLLHHWIKFGQAGDKILIIITGEGRVINMFDVKVVRLVEALGRDRKYGIGLVGGYGAMGGRVFKWHQKIFNLMSSLIFSLL